MNSTLIGKLEFPFEKLNQQYRVDNPARRRPEQNYVRDILLRNIVGLHLGGPRKHYSAETVNFDKLRNALKVINAEIRCSSSSFTFELCNKQ